MTIRLAEPPDAAPLAALLSACLGELHPMHAGTPAEVLERDVLSGAAGQRVPVTACSPTRQQVTALPARAWNFEP
jgi:hypothetical protein